MVVQCPGCDTKYNIPVEKMGKGSAQLRCSRCGKQFALEKSPEGDGVKEELAAARGAEAAASSPAVAQRATDAVEEAPEESAPPSDADSIESRAESDAEADPAALAARATRAAEEAARAAEAAAEARRLAEEAARAAEAAKKAAAAVTAKSAASEPSEGEVDGWGDGSFEVPASEQTTEIDADALEFVDEPDGDEPRKSPAPAPAPPPPPPSGKKAPPPPAKKPPPPPDRQPAPAAAKTEDVDIDLIEDDEPSRETAPLLESADYFETGPSVIVDPSLSADDIEPPAPRPMPSRTDDWEVEDQVDRVSSGGGLKLLGVIMLIVLVLGGAALLYVFVLSGGGDSGFAGIDTQGVELVLAERKGGGQVLMVRGKVVNTTAGAKQHVAVRAQILEPGGAVVREKQAPCGRTWTAAELTTLSSSEIASEYQRLERSERIVPPDGEITCSVVFEIIPTGFSVTSFRPRMIVTQAEPVVYSNQ